MITTIGVSVAVAIVFWLIGFFCGASTDNTFPPMIYKDYELHNRVGSLENKVSNDYYRRPDDIMRISHLLQMDIKNQMDKVDDTNLKMELFAEKLGYEWKETIGSGWIKSK